MQKQPRALGAPSGYHAALGGRATTDHLPMGTMHRNVTMPARPGQVLFQREAQGTIGEFVPTPPAAASAAEIREQRSSDSSEASSKSSGDKKRGKSGSRQKSSKKKKEKRKKRKSKRKRRESSSSEESDSSDSEDTDSGSDSDSNDSSESSSSRSASSSGYSSRDRRRRYKTRSRSRSRSRRRGRRGKRGRRRKRRDDSYSDEDNYDEYSDYDRSRRGAQRKRGARQQAGRNRKGVKFEHMTEREKEEYLKEQEEARERERAREREHIEMSVQQALRIAAEEKAKEEREKLSAVQKIQRMIRQKIMRRRWEGAIYPALRALRLVGGEIVNEIVNELLEDDIIPELLIEILAVKPGDKDPFSHKSMTDRIAAEVLYEISSELIRQESRLVVEREFRNMVSRYLSKAAAVKDAGKAGPLAPIVTDILDQDLVPEMLRVVAREAIAELVQEYIFLNRFEGFFLELVDPIVHDVAHDTLHGVECEQESDAIFNECVKDIAKEAAEESLEELRDLVNEQRKSSELHDVSQTAQKMIYSLVFKHLMKTISSDAEAILVRAEMETLLSQLMARAMIANLRGVQSVKSETRDNVALRAVHQEITARCGLRYLLSQLDDVLNEHEAEIDANEQQFLGRI